MLIYQILLIYLCQIVICCPASFCFFYFRHNHKSKRRAVVEALKMCAYNLIPIIGFFMFIIMIGVLIQDGYRKLDKRVEAWIASDPSLKKSQSNNIETSTFTDNIILEHFIIENLNISGEDIGYATEIQETIPGTGVTDNFPITMGLTKDITTDITNRKPKPQPIDSRFDIMDL